jgi:subtilisin family serine protease
MGASHRARHRWHALVAAALPAAVLVTTTAHASAPPGDPESQPIELPDPTPTDAPNLTPAAPPADVPADAETVEDSYIVVMAADPVVSYDGGVPGLAPTAVSADEKVDTTDPNVEKYVDHIDAEQREVLAASGVAVSARGESYAYALNGFEATLSSAQVAAIERQPNVAKVVPNTIRQLMTDNTPKFLGLSAPNGPWANGLTGEDVVVGVIDSGIWPEHPSFADDGTYTHLDAYDDVPCQFGDTAYNPADRPFTCNNKLLGARDMRIAYKANIGPEVYRSARDYDGHGTHTASTAAGNGGVHASLYGIDRGVISGIAPRARIIAYSACGDQGCFTSDLAASVDQAVADGVDVINFSIGGGASLPDPTDLAFLFAADANVWVAASNGNSGPGAATTGSPAAMPWVTAVGASTQNRTFMGTVRLGNGQLATGSSVTPGTNVFRRLVDAATLGNELCDPTKTFSASIANTIVLCKRGLPAGRVAAGKAVLDKGGAGMILYNQRDDNQTLLVDPHWLPAVLVTPSTGLAIKAYIAAAGATARARLMAGQRVPAQGSVMADFSSRGEDPVAPDIIKPDVTAPGVNILAGNSMTPGIPSGPPGNLFQIISGTSMSSPHVAGLYALLRQAHPDWTAAMAKSAIMTTARQDVEKETHAPADPFDMGAGHVDPSGSPSRAGSMFSPGLVYDAGLVDYYGFLCDVDPSVFASPSSTCDALAGAGVPTTATDLNLASIGDSAVVGTATVTRTVTSVADGPRRFDVDVEAPDGFDVTVEPSSLTLAPGESASYTVTFTNVGAPFDEWRFGSLTWSSGTYDVRSPIALRAREFAAPESVAATGTSGSVTVPVQFGYDGPYTANAHGPVPTTRISGTVVQDPDQTFDPDDPTGTTAVPITVTGSAFLRIALDTADLTPPNPDADIDLYLYDSDGNRVAESTAGGTNEQIDLPLPEDGAYTLYVHGWQVPGPVGTPIGFSLRTWSVPLEPGTGALTIDSAPASAVKGASGEVVASWSGLEPGDEYLGAISHTTTGGRILGLTLVDITA